MKNDQVKGILVKDIGGVLFNPKESKHTISFTGNMKYVSYIVLNVSDNKKNVDLPIDEVIRDQWMHVYKCQTACSCNQVNIQFPNIYRIVSTSFDELINVMSHPTFDINNMDAQVYLGADCSYFEDLPKFTTENQLKQAIGCKATIIKYYEENLILEISDKNVFDKCLNIGAMSIENKKPLFIDLYTTRNNPPMSDIDNDTWYENEMIHYKADIMQFVVKPDHQIFRFKWNSDIWLQQFHRTILPNTTANNIGNLQDHQGISADQMRQLLRMTVMLNTIGAIQNKSCIVDNQQVQLNLDPNLRTILYKHESKLKYGGPIPLTTIPYEQTDAQVLNEDCAQVYKNSTQKYKNLTNNNNN
ncbi:unnamed protein product [Didymodactylos carnosus]|uniref:Uncharacterized protein n=1 Tax=Didymodactylos carnosus TaxID=1234261 RepID=A0A815I7Q9_9BILA|nr:unnamed protein product [Didymodactylos carnosus]CAF1362319.1 unnamed protein product [Didymodactylos carnosus]CAF3551971.1 unnamed protein product [Didymodactylos carnosus]CAF4241879.1 unnamed protein product [Didymodactylos carnosus]